MVSPGEFIPVVEKNGLIIDVDVYVWTKSIQFSWKENSRGDLRFPWMTSEQAILQ